jgi:hypothetical protein
MKKLLFATMVAGSIALGASAQPLIPELLAGSTTLGETVEPKIVVKDERPLQNFRKAEVINVENLEQIQALLHETM